ncbi:MAG: terminase large subunit [Clostridiales bacterium]|nr:terminase large subunit [Clostridiales bacterium]
MTPRDPWVYDEDRAGHVISFLEKYCKHSKGKWGGQPLKLELWQKAMLAAAFGFIDAETGLRKYRKVLLVVGRKNGKSTIAAGVGLYLMVADGEPGAEIYCAATKRDQAKIIWLEAKRMVKRSAALYKRIKPLVAEMVGRGEYDGCTFRPLGSDSETLDGLNVHGAPLDEIHAWPGRELYDVIVDGMGAREQPMIFITTTSGFVREGLYDEEYAIAANVLSGIEEYADEQLLPVIYELENPDEWRDPAMWVKANPGLGTIKNLDELAKKVERAQKTPRLSGNLKCKDFCMPSTDSSAWLDWEEIDNPATFDLEDLRKCYAIGGCDLSATTDLSCASLIIRKADDPSVYVAQHYFIPEKRVEDLELDGKIKEAPYRIWADRGLLTICPGNQVDFRAVTAWFVLMHRGHGIIPLYIGFDRALAGYWLDDMDAHGFTWMGKDHTANVMERVAQGPYTWSQPMKEMGAAFAKHMVNYNNNPITKWCLSNTQAKAKNEDGIESIQPVKLSSGMRIDGMVSLLNAWVIYTRHFEEYMGRVKSRGRV